MTTYIRLTLAFSFKTNTKMNEHNVATTQVCPNSALETIPNSRAVQFRHVGGIEKFPSPIQFLTSVQMPGDKTRIAPPGKNKILSRPHQWYLPRLGFCIAIEIHKIQGRKVCTEMWQSEMWQCSNKRITIFQACLRVYCKCKDSCRNHMQPYHRGTLQEVSYRSKQNMVETTQFDNSYKIAKYE